MRKKRERTRVVSGELVEPAKALSKPAARPRARPGAGPGRELLDLVEALTRGGQKVSRIEARHIIVDRRIVVTFDND